MTNSLANIALTIGDFALTKRMCLHVIDHARCLEDKLEAMCIQIYALSTQPDQLFGVYYRSWRIFENTWMWYADQSFNCHNHP
jgi:hypothetical protein